MKLPSGDPQDLNDGKRTFGLGNGLVPLGNKPLPEPLLIQIYAVSRRH